MSLIKLAMNFNLSNKFKNLFEQSKKRSTLATAGQTIKNIQNGGSTKIKELKEIESIYKDNSFVNKFKRKVIDNSIDNTGKFKIDNIEHNLKLGKKADNILNHIGKRRYLVAGGAIGGSVQGMRGYKNEEDSSLKIQSGIKHGLTGVIEGGALVGGIQIAANRARKLTVSPIAKMHDEYFKDNTWRENLKAANKPIYQRIGKIGAKHYGIKS